jgi:hypothetical protein
MANMTMTPLPTANLKIHEVYLSVQGERLFAVFGG